jgi:RsiW-degrading membrane proteinase PrsW (M82 family)
MSYAFVQLISGSGGNHYSLLTTSEVVIGRDPSCQIVLNSNTYGMVSRRHAVIRPAHTRDGRTSYVVCDLNSANGTYLNGHRLQKCQELHPGDRITCGHDGPEFLFQYQFNHQSSRTQQPAVTPTPMSVTPSVSSSSVLPDIDNNYVSWSQLLPIISPPKDLARKAYLIPGIITVVFVVLLFVAEGVWYLRLLGTYLAFVTFYFVYQLCGKHKPWWVLILTSLATILILKSPIFTVISFIFYNILPGRLSDSVALLPALIGNFCGPGLCEEFIKALPVVGLYLIGRQLKSPRREQIGVWEPLDGILLGAASALGFTLLETLGLYVPNEITQVGANLGAEAGLRAGLQLLIPRILGQVAGHMAWSGWVGYCIGLSVLKPRLSVKIMTLGYLVAAGLHGLWNSYLAIANVAGILFILWLILIGGVSYALLGAAIIKARALSPTRAQNFATRFFQA